VHIQLQPNGETDTHHIAAMAVQDDLQNSGRVDAPLWQPTEWNEEKLKSNKSQMNVELEHQIFGHRAISSLMAAASNAGVWDDINMTFGGDSWYDHCKIAFSPRTALSKRPMRFTGKQLEHLFIDCVPSLGSLRGIKECKEKDFLFVCDPISRYVDKISVPDKSAATTILKLESWRGRMLKKEIQHVIIFEK
jgi:hypothetical protein